MTNTLEPKELTQAIAKVISIAEDMHGLLLAQASDYTDGSNTSWLVQVSTDAHDIEGYICKLKSIGSRLSEILTATLGFEDETGARPGLEVLERLENISQDSSPKRLRRIRVSITQGAINQNLLTLTDARKRGLLRSGEHFKIRFPDGEELETELIQPGNKLRERGRIGAFYRHQEVHVGDYVILAEIEPGVWTLTKEQSATVS